MFHYLEQALDLMYQSIISFNYSEGLNIVDNNGRNRNFDDIDNWLGKRGQAGKKVPKGFPKNF